MAQVPGQREIAVGPVGNEEKLALALQRRNLRVPAINVCPEANAPSLVTAQAQSLDGKRTGAQFRRL
jgi:hypothetical protein